MKRQHLEYSEILKYSLQKSLEVLDFVKRLGNVVAEVIYFQMLNIYIYIYILYIYIYYYYYYYYYYYHYYYYYYYYYYYCY